MSLALASALYRRCLIDFAFYYLLLHYLQMIGACQLGSKLVIPRGEKVVKDKMIEYLF